MTLPKAVLFDCDGVLVDSEPLTIKLLRDDLADHGLQLTMEETTRICFGGTMESAMEEARTLGADLPPDWVAQFYVKMFDVLAQHVEAVPGVWDLVDGLSSRGVKMAVASNGPVKKMDITLARTGLLPKLAPHIYSGRDMQRSKPAPDVYLHAAAQLGVAAADCVVIEDSASGAKAAKAANMRCIGYAAHGIVTQLAPYCDQIAKDMGQVADHLGL